MPDLTPYMDGELSLELWLVVAVKIKILISTVNCSTVHRSNHLLFFHFKGIVG
jgi:hypothetical protein